MRTPARSALSHLVGWAADRRIPMPLRAPVFRTYARFTGADLGEIRDPLASHASLSEFFVRKLKDGARPIGTEPGQLVSPCDGRLLFSGRVESGSLLQAKGRSYSLRDLLGSQAEAQACEGGLAWTIYLSPRDYHRVHAPEECRLADVRRLAGSRFSVAPAVLLRRPVLALNERAVLRLELKGGLLWMVLVGALNVGRIRVESPRRFARGEEVARFEMGSTVILVAPREAAAPVGGLSAGVEVHLGQPIGFWLAAEAALRA